MANEISKVSELHNLENNTNVIVRYPAHGDDFGGILTADILLRMIDLFKDEENPDIVQLFKDNQSMEGVHVVQDLMKQLHGRFHNDEPTFVEDIDTFIPIVESGTDVDVYPSDDDLLSMGFDAVYYVPYEGGTDPDEIRYWWTFD